MLRVSGSAVHSVGSRQLSKHGCTCTPQRLGVTDCAEVHNWQFATLGWRRTRSPLGPRNWQVTQDRHNAFSLVADTTLHRQGSEIRAHALRSPGDAPPSWNGQLKKCICGMVLRPRHANLGFSASEHHPRSAFRVRSNCTHPDGTFWPRALWGKNAPVRHHRAHSFGGRVLPKHHDACGQVPWVKACEALGAYYSARGASSQGRAFTASNTAYGA